MLQIEDQIHAGEYKVGERIPTGKVIAETFGVSRSVVREAVKLLEAKGLIVARQGSGVYVSDNTSSAVSRLLELSVGPQDGALEQLLQFRETLDSSASRWAAELRSSEQLATIAEALDENRVAGAAQDVEEFTTTDYRFHSAIAQASGNSYVAAVLRAVHEMQHDVVALMIHDIGSLQAAVAEHEAIFNAIAARNAPAAAEAALAHIRSTSSNILKNAGKL